MYRAAQGMAGNGSGHCFVKASYLLIECGYEACPMICLLIISTVGWIKKLIAISCLSFDIVVNLNLISPLPLMSVI